MPTNKGVAFRDSSSALSGFVGVIVARILHAYTETFRDSSSTLSKIAGVYAAQVIDAYTQG